MIPNRSEKSVTRSKQDQEALDILQSKTVLVMIDGMSLYATPLLHKKDMPILQAPMEAVLCNLRNTEKCLEKDPIKAAAYQQEMKKLETLGYVVKLPPETVHLHSESWFIPYHLVQHNGKN